MKKIILASASPQRKELLENVGLKFAVEPPDFEEPAECRLEAHYLARKLSRKKAELVAGKHRNAIVIAADTIVLLGDRIMGKPRSRVEARKMLRSLSGKAHTVITAFTIIDTDTKRTLTRIVETTVHIKKLRREEIDAYVRTGESLDKAGAYAIQGQGAVIVEEIEGDYFNVVGLPLSTLAACLKKFGVDVWQNQRTGARAAKIAACSPAR